MHLQVRCRPKASRSDRQEDSRSDVAEVLRLVKDAGYSLRGIGGSNVEFGGELALAPMEDQGQDLLDVLEAYKPRLLKTEDEESGLSVCIVEDRAGALYDCLAVTAKLNLKKGRVIRDILVGVPDEEQKRANQVPIQIYSEDGLSGSEGNAAGA